MNDNTHTTAGPDDASAPQGSNPIWLNWHEPEVADLSDQEVLEYIAYWRGRREEYLRKRQGVADDHPDAYRWGYSAWKCSSKESIGHREVARRQIRREAGDGA